MDSRAQRYHQAPPTLRGETVMLDLGANIVCDARNLVQFAVMGGKKSNNNTGRSMRLESGLN